MVCFFRTDLVSAQKKPHFPGGGEWGSGFYGFLGGKNEELMFCWLIYYLFGHVCQEEKLLLHSFRYSLGSERECLDLLGFRKADSLFRSCSGPGVKIWGGGGRFVEMKKPQPRWMEFGRE